MNKRPQPSSSSRSPSQEPTTRWWVVAAAVVGTLVAQLYLCFFFSWGKLLPRTVDANPGNYGYAGFRFPPQGVFSTDFWLGWPYPPNPLTPHSLLANLPAWWYFTICYPIYGTLAVLTGYLFLRELRFNRAVAIFGGLAYGWQGPLLSNLYGAHFAPMGLLALLPLAMWSVLRTFQGREFYTASLAGALLGSMICLQPDHGILVSLLIGFLYLARVGQVWRIDAAKARTTLLQLATTIILAALVAWPTIQTMFQTQITQVRQGESNDPAQRWEWATQWSLPPAETIDYLVPGFWGWRSGDPERIYWGRIGRSAGWEESRQGFRDYSINANSFGTVIGFLALVGAWAFVRQRITGHGREFFDRDVRFYGLYFTAVLVLCLVLAWGKYAPLYSLFYQLPYMDTWRNPLKFMVPGGFCLTVLAAYGAQAISGAWRGRNDDHSWLRSVGKLAGGLALAGLSGIVFTFVTASHRTAALAKQGFDATEISAIILNQQLSLGVAALILGAVSILLWLGQTQQQTQPNDATGWPRVSWLSSSRICLLFSLLTVAQMVWVHRHYLESYEFAKAYRSNDLLEQLRADPLPARVKVAMQDPLLRHYVTAIFPYYQIPTIDISATSRVPEDYAAFFKALADNPLRLWQLAGVKYWILPAQLAGTVLSDPALAGKVANVNAYRAVGTSIEDFEFQRVDSVNAATHLALELKDPLPKALCVPNAEILPDVPALQARLADPAWNPRSSLLVTRAAFTSPPSPATSTNHAARIVAYGKQRIVIEVDSETGCFLLINDRFDAHWEATINGQPARVFPANLLLRGLQLPPGSSQVILNYRYSPTPLLVHLAALAAVGLYLPLYLKSWRVLPSTELHTQAREDR